MGAKDKLKALMAIKHEMCEKQHEGELEYRVILMRTIRVVLWHVDSVECGTRCCNMHCSHVTCFIGCGQCLLCPIWLLVM